MKDLDITNYELYDLRISVARKFLSWKAEIYPRKLLGYTSRLSITSRHVQLLKALNGPHGYAIYRALVAKQKDMRQ